ncbi:uncharacterized protein LOC131602809 [Vicia villosa]|uniref:uncharacterized protein LOC131602809 n=1 Tax=Vicia villosa TaxID=3911 RepID=UPI00273BA289|nr:uncharacterized protein LOC131602809 [Vicia villosa]
MQEVYDLRVKDLLLPNSKHWDISKVRSTLDHLGADLVLKVPLMEDVVEDRLIWQEETNREYSVKSGYRVWRKMQSSSFGKNGVEGNWNALWNITAPPRAKQLFREDNRDAGRLAVMLYNLRRSRNKVVWQDTGEDASSIGVKCNVDAGFSNICGTTNRGWCFRDHLGRFQIAGVAWDEGFLSVMEAEAMALKEAVQKAISLHLLHVVFESDCQSVVHAVYSK